MPTYTPPVSCPGAGTFVTLVSRDDPAAGPSRKVPGGCHRASCACQLCRDVENDRRLRRALPLFETAHAAVGTPPFALANVTLTIPLRVSGVVTIEKFRELSRAATYLVRDVAAQELGIAPGEVPGILTVGHPAGDKDVTKYHPHVNVFVSSAVFSATAGRAVDLSALGAPRVLDQIRRGWKAVLASVLGPCRQLPRCHIGLHEGRATRFVLRRELRGFRRVHSRALGWSVRFV